MKRVAVSLPDNSVEDVGLDKKTLDSLYPNPKIDTRVIPPHAGVININWISTGVLVADGTDKVLYSFPHGYDYIPTVLACFSLQDASGTLSGILPFATAFSVVLIDADATFIRIRLYALQTGGLPLEPFNIQVRFYVMAERGYDT